LVFLDDKNSILLRIKDYLFSQLWSSFRNSGSKTKTIVGTNIPVMHKVFKGKGQLFMVSPIKKLTTVMVG
jgi:hypothetical protein